MSLGQLPTKSKKLLTHLDEIDSLVRTNEGRIEFCNQSRNTKASIETVPVSSCEGPQVSLHPYVIRAMSSYNPLIHKGVSLMILAIQFKSDFARL